MVYSQSPISIPNTASQCGVLYYIPPSPSQSYYMYQGNYSTIIQVGNPNSDICRGRGFLFFNLVSIGNFVNNINDVTGAKLIFDTGSSSAGNNSVKITKLSSMMIGTDAPSAYSQIGSSGQISVAQDLTANTNNNVVVISKQTIVDAYNSLQSLLFIGLVHLDEVNNGIEIKNANLVIDYTVPVTSPPSAPTGLQVSNVNQTTCTLSWDRNTTQSVTKYEVYQVLSTGNTKKAEVTQPSSGSKVSVNLTGLTENTPYTFCVKALNAAGGSGCSTVSFTTKPKTPSISLPSYLCKGQSYSLSATNWLSGSFKWESSSNLSISDVWSSSTTISANSTGSGWVKIMYGNEQMQIRYVDVEAAPAKILSLDLPSSAYSSSPVVLNVTANTLLLSPSDISWTCSPTYDSDIQPYGNPVLAAFCKTGSYSVTASITNNCGTASKTNYISVTVSGLWNGPCNVPYVKSPNGNYKDELSDAERKSDFETLIYPNPVSNTLSIEVIRQSSDRNIVNNDDPTYDIRLYDGQGNMLRQASVKDSKVEFNVSKLPNGIYYLHVYDGVSATPEIQQIMVEH